ncbi:MAG: 1-acyl-sn-glycerol-3-phosphate acyltransferase [Chloroflexi bacterium]|nr:1-acyl-sn-glycerol-3-phosphate acyltransferase [Chloroflexota bacterium]
MKRFYVPPYYRSFLIMVRTLLFCFARFSITGKENVPPRGPLIVVANHISNYDPHVIGTAIPRRVRTVAKVELFRHPLTALIVRGCDAIPVNREGIAKSTLEEIVATLARDGAVGMFPEGSRSKSGLARPKPGVAAVAIRTGAPILPVAITGTNKIKSPLSLLKRHRIQVTIGQAFTLPQLEGNLGKAQVTALSDMIMERIAALLPPENRGAYPLSSGKQP